MTSNLFVRLVIAVHLSGFLVMPYGAVLTSYTRGEMPRSLDTLEDARHMVIK